MAMIIRAAQGAQDIPAGFPILLSSEMQIIEPAFAYLLEQAQLHAYWRRRCGPTVSTSMTGSTAWSSRSGLARCR